jgi:ankyrin repeat protein
MKANFLFLLLSFVLAGSHFPSTSSKILATFNEKISSGDTSALHSILDTNPNFIKNPFAKPYRNDGFLVAVQRGHTSVVELLLKHANINAAANNNVAIRVASMAGNTDIVRMLLRRPEVNPGALNNEALIAATRNGHTDIVRLLLAHPKLIPTSGRSHAVFLATSNNHADIVKLFLHDGRFNAALYQSHTLDRAAQFGNIDFVRFLLGYPYFSRIAPEVVMKGDLLTIKTLVEAGYKFDQNTFDITLERARLRWEVDLIEYLETLKETPKLPERPLIAMTEQCAICLSDENLLEGFMTSCNHQFHAECLQQWIAKHKSCPMCRSSII